MAHAFDGHSFQQLLNDAERLVAGTSDLEQRLTRLTSVIEEQQGAALLTSPLDAGVPASGVHFRVGPAHADLPVSGDLAGTIRDLCLAARNQRQLSETILARLVGDLSQGDGSWPRARVLIVDDSGDNRELTAAALEASGFGAITASNGLEGVIVAHYAQPAVVLMDVTMPVLDGIEATRLLKASPVTQHMKVIAHTAKPDFFAGPMARLFVDVLPKPASPDVIVAYVSRFVDVPLAGPDAFLPKS